MQPVRAATSFAHEWRRAGRQEHRGTDQRTKAGRKNRKRELNENAVDFGVRIKRIDEGQQVRFACRRRKRVLNGVKAACLRSPAFGFDIDLACRVFAHDDYRKAGAQSSPREGSRLGSDAVDNGRGDSLAVENKRAALGEVNEFFFWILHGRREFLR